MTSEERALKELIGRRSPSQLEFVAARDRVIRELRDTPAERLAPRIGDTAAPAMRWRTALSLAAAAVVILAVATVPWTGDDLVRGGDTGRMLTLDDGSQVEMRAHSELTIDRAADGIRINLGKGGIIVSAAKQRNGHLYVQTKDMTVAVVGTVFLVSASDEGSRVAVIEGEVRVRERGTPLRGSGRQGDVETSLRPGEHVSTSPALAARPVKEEITWSRHADAHLAILATFQKGMADTAGRLERFGGIAATAQGGAATAVQEFEEASIRACDADNLPPAPAGARGGGANSFQMTPGRTHALCVTVATLIRTAYGYGPANLDFSNAAGRDRMRAGVVYGLGEEDGLRVRGGPDWVRSEKYTIEAVASDAADAEAMQGPMLRALIEKRLRLKAHIETEQVPAFALTVAPGGLRVKPVVSGACEPLQARPGSPLLHGHPVSVLTPPRSVADVRRGEKPSCGLWGHRNGPNWVSLGGDVPFDALTGFLGFRLGAIRVFDRTGLTDRFNFVLEFVLDENTPGPGVPGAELPAPPQPADIPRAATIFSALEEQLGLKLEPARAPREFIVIDSIERPSPN